MASLLAPCTILAEPATTKGITQSPDITQPSLEFLLFLAESETADNELITPMDLADMNGPDGDNAQALPEAVEEDAQ
jgi:hypothetical protein